MDKYSMANDFMKNILSEAINGELKTLNSIDIASIEDDSTRGQMNELKKELNRVIKDREKLLNKNYPLRLFLKGESLPNQKMDCWWWIQYYKGVEYNESNISRTP